MLITDLALYHFARDPVVIARFETAKGWAFVMLGAAFLYAVAFVSARRLAHARAAMAAVVESIADGVLLLGPDRCIKHANPAARRMLGCDKLEGMSAKEFSRRFRVSYPSGALVPPLEYISQRVFEEAGPLQYKAILHPQDAPEIVISVTAAAVLEPPQTKPETVVSVMHDITASDKLETLRDQFLAAAAHALKTPVAVIKTNVQALARGRVARLAHSTAAIERQCETIDLIVQNLLVLARVRSGTLKLRQHVVALQPLVDQVARRAAAVLPRNELRCELEASPRVYGDRERLGLAVRNLIARAAALATPGTSIRVLLEADADHAQVGVRYRPLLGPEERIEETDPEHDELGVGRLVLQTIAKAHGGTLDEETGATGEVLSRLRLPTTRPA